MTKRTGCDNMAGQSPLDSNIRGPIVAWLSGALKVGKSARPGLANVLRAMTPFIDVHISELNPEAKGASERLAYAYECFVTLTAELRQWSDYVMAVLSIPLRESDDAEM